MAHTKDRVGYFTFEGLDGPRRLVLVFYFDPVGRGDLELATCDRCAGTGR